MKIETTEGQHDQMTDKEDEKLTTMLVHHDV